MIRDIINKLYDECLINKTNGYIVQPISFGNNSFDRSIIKHNEKAIEMLYNDVLNIMYSNANYGEADIESFIKINILKRLANNIEITEEIYKAYMVYGVSKKINSEASFLGIQLRFDESDSSIIHAYMNDEYIGPASLDMKMDDCDNLVYEVNFENKERMFRIKKEYTLDNSINRLISYEDINTGNRKYFKENGNKELEVVLNFREDSVIKIYDFEVSEDNLKTVYTVRSASPDFFKKGSKADKIKGFISKFKKGEIKNFIMADAEYDKHGYYIGNIINMNKKRLKLNETDEKRKFNSEEEFESSYKELLTHPKNQKLLKDTIDIIDSHLIGFKDYINGRYQELNEIIESKNRIDSELLDIVDTIDNIQDKDKDKIK